MSILEQFQEALPRFLLALGVMAAVLVGLWVANWFLLRRRRELGEERRFPRRIAMLVLAGCGIVLMLIVLPVSEGTRNQLLALLGLLLTAVIALSSTTFMSNAMAGLMLRAVGSFKPGDFVRVGEQFGRVTERGLFHTEIQTEDRDLTTLPNLYLVAHPLTVVRASGTIVSATVSLGYDIPHERIERRLIEAAENSKLQDPFVQILDLGDFSVTYRVAGFLPEVKQLLTARSHLRTMMLDTLHGAGIEIVSPSFMNQRPLTAGTRILPQGFPLTRARTPKEDQIPEELIFDKAEAAGKVEQLREEREKLLAEVAELEARLKGVQDSDRSSLEAEVRSRRSRAEFIARIIESVQEGKQE